MDVSRLELISIIHSYHQNAESFGDSTIKLLEKYGFKLRQKDGVLYSIIISYPKTIQNSIVVGLRYVKKDGTYTEDHFLFTEDNPIKAFYKGSIEKILPEYKGTHKDQLEEHK